MKPNTAAEPSLSEVETRLKGYDIITFDVFDTLIARCVLKPTDVFSLVEARSQAEGFARARRQAELDAYRTFGETATLSQIYDTLHSETAFSQQQCEELIALELETELEIVIPRLSMRALVETLLRQGKRIILCSDMYLSSADIRKLLAKCGYPEGLELWVSCEVGATKHSGGMWEKLFAALPAEKTVIHVGDNEDADYRSLKRLGKDALLIGSGMEQYRSSPLQPYLARYETGSLANSLILGYLINQACFNSPFSGEPSEEIVSVWGGALFACFMDFLVKNRDDSQLLFATREGYLLRPMYEGYCASLGVQPQCNALFYSSRTAACAASVSSEEDLREVMRKPEYRGTLGSFTASRLNFDLSAHPELCEKPITLPAETNEALALLRPLFPEIFRNAEQQKLAYRTYIDSIRQDGKSLTVVDVGYNGTIQNAVSRLLGQRVDGLYIFLNSKAYLKKSENRGGAIADPNSGDHPVYSNLLFLEAVMQVPYGQLRKMELREGNVVPKFNRDANFSKEIPAAQERFCRFTQWFAGWQKKTHGALEPDFALAEAIWVCCLRFDLLPNGLLEGFWLADDFGGHPLWKYDPQKHQWQGNQVVTPLAFSLIPEGTKLSAKQKLKFFVKKHIPDFAFDWAKTIWGKYLR